MRGMALRVIVPVLCTCAAWACKAPPLPDPGEAAGPEGTGGGGPAGAVAAGPQEAAQPEWTGEVVFSETEFDLGKVKRGEKAAHSFTITNKTNRVLNILDVRGS